MDQGDIMMNIAKRTDATIKICFIAPSAYPLLSGENPKNVLGPDVHQVLLANEVIKYNFKVTFIAHKEGGAPVEYINGIEVIKIPEDAFRLRILNFILKVFRIWNAMRKANAHIYFHAGGMAGVVSPFCKLIRRKYIYDIASDALVNRVLVTKKIKEFSRSIFSLGTFGNGLDIKLADAIIVQSEFQKKMLKKNFGKDGFLIKMPFPLSRHEIPEKANPLIVLWVGAMAEVKQPELFVKLAEAISEARFKMIGGHSGNKELYDKMKENSKRVPNFEFLGVIPFDEINGYFSQASILVNTSMFEGFPHALIQAWIHYVPVVSLNADPDGIICKYKIGFHSKTFDQLGEDVKKLLENEHLRKQMGENARQYSEREHDITKNIREYLDVFEHI
jgi:glycosyltransferase involved in cell wall biosynthesis